MIPHVDPSVVIGLQRSYNTSISNFLCRSVGSLCIFIPNFRIGLGLSAIFPFCFQTTNLAQTPVLPPPLN